MGDAVGEASAVSVKVGDGSISVAVLVAVGDEVAVSVGASTAGALTSWFSSIEVAVGEGTSWA